MFAVGQEGFDRELFSSLKSHVSDSENLQREQRIEGRLANVKRQLEMDQRAFHEEVCCSFVVKFSSLILIVFRLFRRLRKNSNR